MFVSGTCFSEMGNQNIFTDTNLNDYYDANLKYARLKKLWILTKNAYQFLSETRSSSMKDFVFIRMNLEYRDNLDKLFKANSFDVVCNLATQAGLRYSIEDPYVYSDSNILYYKFFYTLSYIICFD